MNFFFLIFLFFKKGPTEAGGINVDEAGLIFTCGSHVTPPVGPGSYFHSHRFLFILFIKIKEGIIY